MLAVQNVLRRMVASKRSSIQYQGHELDMCYVTPCLIAMSYPCTGLSTMWRNDIRVVRDFLNQNHRDHWRVWNLSGVSYDVQGLEGRVVDVHNIPDHHAPTLNVLLDTINQMAFFLAQDDENVCVIHCLAGKGRTGTLISAYLAVHGDYAAEDALQIFCTSRGQPVEQPSQRRYVEYAQKLKNVFWHPPPPMSEEDGPEKKTQIFFTPLPEAKKIVIRHVEVSLAPNMDGEGIWPVLVIENDFVPIFSQRSPRNFFADNLVRFGELDVAICGDICIRLMHDSVGSMPSVTSLPSLSSAWLQSTFTVAAAKKIEPKENNNNDTNANANTTSLIPVFRCQFNTLMLPQEEEEKKGEEKIMGRMVEFSLAELDEANEQPLLSFSRRFNPACKLRIFFE